jgi:hypothetical protein
VTPLSRPFPYQWSPNERALRALDQVREVYGVRRISFDKKARAIQVEYDASRLRADDIAALLREAGVSLEKSHSAHDASQDQDRWSTSVSTIKS